MNNYKELIRDFIIENFLFGEGNKLAFDTPLLESGIIDSTGVLELVSFIEENYNFTFADSDLIQDNFSSLDAIDSFLKSKIEQVST